MKIFLALLSIALLAEISWAASIQRFKRDPTGAKNTYQIMKVMVADLKPILEAITKEMPTSGVYRKYKQDLTEILDMYNDNNEEDLCVQKLTNIIEKFGDLLAKCEKDYQIEKLEELFLKHKLNEFVSKYQIALYYGEEPSFFELMETC